MSKLTPFALLADCQNYGRLEYESLSEQALMELMTRQTHSANFTDSNGNFFDIEHWEGVDFGTAGRVRCINWFMLGVARGTLDTQWIPPRVEEFCVTCSALEGTLDTKLLPRVLRRLYILGNNFRGLFALEGLPDTIVEVHIYRNAFEGPVNLAELPRVTEELYAGWNRFTGSVDLTVLPPALTHLSLHENELSGEISLITIPVRVEMLSLSRNCIQQKSVLVGDLPPGIIVDLTGNTIGEFVDGKGNVVKSSGRRKLLVGGKGK